MKTKKLVYLLLLIVSTIFVFSACGTSGVSEKQLKSDIIMREEVQNCYNSKWTDVNEYQIKEISITKEQLNKEEKEDKIFCNVTIENKYFNVNFDLELLYNYYDKGGWIMDEFLMENPIITPHSSPEIENVRTLFNEEVDTAESIDAFYSGGGFDAFYVTPNYTLSYGNLDVISIEMFDVVDYCEKLKSNESTQRFELDRLDSVIKSINDENIKYTKVEVQYISPVLSVNGYYYMAFIDNEWQLSFETSDDEEEETNDPLRNLEFSKIMHITDYKADYSNALGYYRLYSNYGNTGNIDISSITNDQIELTLNYDIKPWIISVDDQDVTDQYYCKIPTGEATTTRFDQLEGRFIITSCYGYNDEFLEYNPKENAWVTSITNDKFRISDDIIVNINFYEIDNSSWNEYLHEIYLREYLDGYSTLTIEHKGNDITVKDAIDECITHLGSYTSYDYSNDGKTLLSAYGLENKEDGGIWCCYVNGERIESNYCDYKIEYGDEINIVYVYDDVFMYHQDFIDYSWNDIVSIIDS